MTSTAQNAAPLRYSAEELQEFEVLIHAKLAQSEETLHAEKDSLMRLSSHRRKTPTWDTPTSDGRREQPIPQ